MAAGFVASSGFAVACMLGDAIPWAAAAYAKPGPAPPPASYSGSVFPWMPPVRSDWLSDVTYYSIPDEEPTEERVVFAPIKRVKDNWFVPWPTGMRFKPASASSGSVVYEATLSHTNPVRLATGLPFRSLRASAPGIAFVHPEGAVEVRTRAAHRSIRPLWLGVALNGLCTGGLFVCVFFTPTLVRRLRFVPPGRCRHCRYEAGALPICPECGRPHTNPPAAP